MAITINGNGTISGYTPTTISGTLTGSNLPSGSILQVKSFTKTDVSSFDLSATYFSSSSQTGIQVSITPSNASNKILLLGQVGVDVVGQQYNIGAAFEKGGSVLSGSVGDTDGNRKRVTSLGDGSTASQAFNTIPLMYEDTAGGTSAITYGIVINNPSSITRTVYINRAVSDDDTIYRRRTVSTITAVEVKA